MAYKLNLANKSGEEFIQAFKDIPVNETELDLRKQDLCNKTTDELVKAFSNIPGNITSICLFANYLAYNKPVKELIAIFQALPASVTTLDLRANRFDALDSSALDTLLKALPPTITHVNLGNNQLSITLDVQLGVIPQAESKTRLVLSRDYGNYILPFLSAVKQGIFHLDLAHSVLSYLLPKSMQPRAFIDRHISRMIQADDHSLLKAAYIRNNGSPLFFTANEGAEDMVQALRDEAAQDKNGAAHKTLQHFVLS